MEPSEAGSPDSGYRSSCSPNSLQSDVVNTKGKSRFSDSLIQIEDKLIGNNEAAIKRETLPGTVHLKDKLSSTFGNNRKFDSFSTTNSQKAAKHSLDGFVLDDSTQGPRSEIVCPEKKRKARMGRQKCVEEENSSPVLGIRILPIEEVKKFSSQLGETRGSGKMKMSNEVGTEEPGQGAFVCRLCSESHENAMALAQHKCVRIVNERYSCLECNKSFGCPANLASHKRWHKPKDGSDKAIVVNLKSSELNPENSFLLTTSCKESESKNDMTTISNRSPANCTGGRIQKAIYPCPVCKRRFRRDSNRRKHAHVKHQLILAPQVSEKKDKTRKISADDNSSRGSASPDEGVNRSLNVNIQTSQPEKIFDDHRNVNNQRFRAISQTPTIYTMQLQQSLVKKSFQQKKLSFSSSSLNSGALKTQNEEAAYDLSMRKRKRDQRSESAFETLPTNKVSETITDPNQPLDLSLKTSKRAKLRHSIAEITKPKCSDAPTVLTPLVASFANPSSDVLLNYFIASKIRNHGPPPLLYQGSDLLKVMHPSVRWPVASTSLSQDFYRASAFNSGRYVAPSPHHM